MIWFFRTHSQPLAVLVLESVRFEYEYVYEYDSKPNIATSKSASQGYYHTHSRFELALPHSLFSRRDAHPPGLAKWAGR